jgi:hypothetical protein
MLVPKSGILIILQMVYKKRGKKEKKRRKQGEKLFQLPFPFATKKLS